MSYRWLCLVVVLLGAGGWSTIAEAETDRTSSYVPGESSTITVDALPLQAEVRLDGVLVGTAHDLIARPLPVVPGAHVVQVSALGYRPSLVNVLGDQNWATRVQLQLVPDRR
ncbi:MAG TPA: PEGA domain-containing protein [Methylomirabilota bacterium]|nr:PEGA domain-containing protein [Methylomirabilota bacterium]